MHKVGHEIKTKKIIITGCVGFAWGHDPKIPQRREKRYSLISLHGRRPLSEIRPSMFVIPDLQRHGLPYNVLGHWFYLQL